MWKRIIFFFWDRVSLWRQAPGWSAVARYRLTATSASAFQVAGITGLSHCARPHKCFYCEDTYICISKAALLTIVKTWTRPKFPPVSDRLKKENLEYFLMEYYAAIQKNEIMSFAGTWKKLGAIFLSKLTQEQKTKHCMFSLISKGWTMRTHGHREGNAIHWGLPRVGGKGRESLRKNT